MGRRQRQQRALLQARWVPGHPARRGPELLTQSKARSPYHVRPPTLWRGDRLSVPKTHSHFWSKVVKLIPKVQFSTMKLVGPRAAHPVFSKLEVTVEGHEVNLKHTEKDTLHLVRTCVALCHFCFQHKYGCTLNTCAEFFTNVFLTLGSSGQKV